MECVLCVVVIVFCFYIWPFSNGPYTFAQGAGPCALDKAMGCYSPSPVKSNVDWKSPSVKAISSQNEGVAGVLCKLVAATMA